MATKTTKKTVAKKSTTTKTATKKTTAKKTTATKTVAKKTAAKPAVKKTTPKKVVEPTKIGGEITVNGNKLMKTLQKEFSDKFEYLTLCFIIDADRQKSVNVKGINTNKRLSEVRKKNSNEEISLHGRTKVENIEKYFWDELGIAVQIGICNYSGHKHYFPIGTFNSMTLTAANEWAKNNGCKKVGATELKQICSGTIF